MKQPVHVRLLATAVCVLLWSLPAFGAEQSAELDALAERAQRLSWEQRFDEALALYAEVLARDPEHELALRERAKVLSWAGRYDEAIEAFRALLADDPEDLEARLGLARVLSWSGEIVAARDEYTTVLATHPDHPGALLGIAQTWAWSGDLRRARPAYEAAARAATDPRLANIGLAYLDLWEGATASARRRAEQLADRYPDDAETLDLLAATRRATAPWVSGSWDQLDDSDRNLLTTIRVEAGLLPARGPALRLAYADYDVRTFGRRGTIRSLQGTATWTPRARHQVEAMLGLDRMTSPGFDGHDVSDWGLRWSFTLQGAWNGSLQARREPFRYSVPLIDNRIVIDSFTAAASGPIGPRWRLAGEASAWRLSDDNRRLAADVSLRRSTQYGEHTLEPGLNLRWLDWQQDLDNGYFDPDNFLATGLGLRAHGPIPGRDQLDYNLSAELGLQSFDQSGVRTSNDPYYVLVGRLGWQATEGLRVEAWGEAGSYASQGAADWRYTRVGVKLLHRFGMGR